MAQGVSANLKTINGKFSRGLTNSQKAMLGTNSRNVSWQCTAAALTYLFTILFSYLCLIWKQFKQIQYQIYFKINLATHIVKNNVFATLFIFYAQFDYSLLAKWKRVPVYMFICLPSYYAIPQKNNTFVRLPRLQRTTFSATTVSNFL